MIADPLWSCVMLLCGPLRYLVILLVEWQYSSRNVLMYLLLADTF